MANPVVIDLSHHNPTPNWATLKANGTVGIIHKATEGTSYVDDQLFVRARAAMDAGLCWSTYHFLRPGSMQYQMDHYLGTIDPRQGERICLDHEDSGVTLDDLIDAVRIVQTARPDLQITIYSGHLIEEQLGSGHSDVLAGTSLWTAQYCAEDDLTWPQGTWPVWSLWQYTDQAAATGISQKIDGNKWNGDPDALVAWFGPPGVEPAPTPEPEPEKVPLLVDIPAGVDYVVKVDGIVVLES